MDALLKSLGPQDPEWLQKSQKIWTQLDDMAQNDPSAYKTFIEKARKDVEESRLVKPGWGIMTFIKKGKLFSKIFINLGASNRISPPESLELNNVSVPLIVGTPRSFENTKVLDIVYHTSVINKSLENTEYLNAILDLSWGACKEILNWEIFPSKGLEKHQNMYYGTYGWDDKGSPIPDMIPKEISQSEIVYKDTLAHSDSIKSLENLKEPLQASKEKILIQEIQDKEKTEPPFKIIHGPEIIKVLVCLQGIKSGQEANVSFNNGRLTVDTKTEYLLLDLENASCVSRAEFSKNIGILAVFLTVK